MVPAYLPGRALDVTLTVTALQATTTVEVSPAPQITVHLYGPGDVIGIDPRHVVRTEPRNLTPNFEPNYLAGIEFDQPDFPWLCTPARPNGNRLRPWLALILLKDGEWTTPRVPPHPLPVIDIVDTSALQPLDDAWNWAHAQISGDGDLQATVTGNPAAVVSRLLCPRRLDPETRYTAFLVPAFDIGRQAGLGQDVSTITTADPAWTSGTAAPLRMPVYYRFEFQTSDAGDFESLVRKLTPTVLPAEVGIAPMAVDHPLQGIPGAGAPLGLEGALRSVLTVPSDWTGSEHDAFQAAVQDLVNEGSDTVTDDPDDPVPADPRIVPPTYGKWHAGITSLDRTKAGWLPDLNLDPRNRTGAGMGTQVMLNQRVPLMASAWAQVAGVLAANALLRQAQLSRGALRALWTRHLQPAGEATLLTLTAPLHARMLASPRTVAATLAASRVPSRLLSGSFRRLARPLGPTRRRAARLAGLPGTGPGGASTRPSLLERVNADEIRVAPPPLPPGGMTSIDQVSSTEEANALPPGLPSWLGHLLSWLATHLGGRLVPAVIGLALLIGALLIVVPLALGAPATLVGVLAVVAVAIVATAVLARPWLTGLAQQDSAAEQLRYGHLTGAAVRAAAPAASFVVADPPSGLGTAITGAANSGATETGPAGTDSPTAARLRQAAGELLDAVHDVPIDPPLAEPLDLSALSGTVLARLDPNETVVSRMNAIVKIAGGPWFAPDPIEPIMAAPSFPQPMYVPLRDLNQDYLLPGVELIPPDSLGAVVANHAFIEAYLVGLNHEMARQLLWNGYPTDQRGSYFRQFWDVAGYTPQPGDPTDPSQLTELLKDIPSIHTWPTGRTLGLNENRTDVVVDNVVLLVRGELLRRYPNTDIFAGKAMAGSGGEHGRVLDVTDERRPIFRGTLSPDITFFGFNLSVDDARGGTTDSPEGFFFVFQEQVTETRFGLEPQSTGTVTSWADLSWTNFGGPLPASTTRPERVVVDPGSGTLTESSVSSVFAGMHPSEISSYRLASSVFASVLANRPVPKFLNAAVAPDAVALDGSNTEDTAVAWGQDAAQTAAITLRLPFRILVHADSLLPPATP